MNEAAKVLITPYTIRGIELDATGSVSPGWFSRILEDTRWRAFAKDDYVLRGVMDGGVAKAGHFEYLHPLTYGDAVEISTFVARTGRTSFDFGHRIVKTSDGTVAVRARMTVVNLEQGRPAPIDPIVATFIVDEPAPPARAWPEGTRTNAWRREWVVRPSDQDSFGHVNQARYVDFIDDTRWFAAKAGQVPGLEGPLAALSVEYVRETHAGDRVSMETWVTGDRSRACELSRVSTGEVLTRGQVFGA